MRRLLFLLLLACVSFLGCDENVDIGLVAEQILSEQASAIQTTLPAEVLAAMKIDADKMDETLKRMLEFDPNKVGFAANATAEQISDTIAFRLNLKEKVIEKGIHEMDFHAMQQVFYTKYIDAGGIAIVANEKVEDVLLYAAKDAILVMTSKHPELRERLLSKHGRFYMILVAEKSDFYDMPELQLNTAVIFDTDEHYISWAGACNSNSGNILFARRATGAFEDVPTVTGNCFAYPIHRSVCPPVLVFVHEFAHILEWEIEYHQLGFRERLQEAYNQQNFTEEQRGNYHMASAPHEYFASGVDWWFRGGSWRDKLYKEHPELTALIEEWFLKVDCVQETEWIQPDLGDGWLGPTEVIYHAIYWKTVEE